MKNPLKGEGGGGEGLFPDTMIIEVEVKTTMVPQYIMTTAVEPVNGSVAIPYQWT
jgi:hypothetical protein